MSTIQFQETGFLHRDVDGKEHFFNFRSPLRLRFLPLRNKVMWQSRGDKAVVSDLPPKELRELLPEIFRRWSAVDPEAAKKAAFDYAEDRRGFCKLVLAVCLLFTGPMAVALVNDSWKQTSCSRVLAQSTTPGNVTVAKIKKEKKGQYILDLQFTAANGQLVKGTERWISEEEDKIPKMMPMVYAPEQPECWALTDEKGQLSWAKRRYFAAVSGMFGVFFLALTLYGLIWSIVRLVRIPPFRDEIRKQFNFN